MGISLRTYQRIEYGQQKPNVYVVVRLQRLFQKDISEIMEEYTEWREERFRIQCPKHFLVGDSGRFEKSPQGKDSDFVVDYAPPEMFEAGIVLQEMGTEGDTYCTMYVYFAPEEHLPVYMDSMKYDLQKVSIRKIFVDTEEYLIKVDEKTKSFMQVRTVVGVLIRNFTGKENGERLTDAVIVFLCMPDEMKFQEMEAVDRGTV